METKPRNFKIDANGEGGKEVEGKFHHWRDLEPGIPLESRCRYLVLTKIFWIGDLKMEEI